MPTVVPSQILTFIDAELRWSKNPEREGVQLAPPVCGTLNALLRLIDHLPSSLLPSDPETYAAMIQSQESVRYQILQAQNLSPHSNFPYLYPDGGGKRSQVQIIRDALASCPDEVPPRQSKEFEFIRKDAAFRKSLLADLEASRSALQNGEWKAATVLAGSLAEALLLWAILKKKARIQSALAGAISAGKLKKGTSPDPLWWGLNELVEVAEYLGLIEAATANQTRLTKDFRNLIHPGRTLRTKESCDLGTAFAASAAVEFVSRDLRARFT